MRGLSGQEFAVLVLVAHTGMAHVDEQICTMPDCASVRLLHDHSDDWMTMSVVDLAAWIGTE